MQNSLQFTPNSALARNKVPTEYKWKIIDIFPDDKAWEEAGM